MKTVIHAEFDDEAVRESIVSAETIEDAEGYFNALAEVVRVKGELSAAMDVLKSFEDEAKGLINAKAKKLYGDDWQVVKGHGFKITRSKTGAIYDITGKPAAKFVKVKKTVDSDEVENFMIKHDGKLPAGIEYNPKRGESIRITAVSGEDR